jgi:hypothetical protein
MKAMLLVLPLVLVVGCATPREAELLMQIHEAREAVRQQELFVAGVQDDNAVLQTLNIELVDEIRRQQLEIAKARSACDI